jgi:alkylhydroperoxidase family enzyme
VSRIGDFADDDVTGFAVRSPLLGAAMAEFSRAVYTKNRLPLRTREAARIVIALANECVTCQNPRDSEGEAHGITEEFYDYAAQWRTWPGYSDAERIAMEFAHRFASDHTALREDDDFWARAAEHFDDDLMTDLAISCAMWVGIGRVLRTLDIGQACRITL